MGSTGYVFYIWVTSRENKLFSKDRISRDMAHMVIVTEINYMYNCIASLIQASPKRNMRPDVGASQINPVDCSQLPQSYLGKIKE